MTVYFASDHRGFALKDELMRHIAPFHTVVDCGNSLLDPSDDHVDFVQILAEKMATDPSSRGVVICGSGCGVNIAANRFAHLRATIGNSEAQIAADCHDDLVNVLALGAEYISPKQAELFVDLFLNAPRGDSEKYLRRTAKLGLLGTHEATSELC